MSDLDLRKLQAGIHLLRKAIHARDPMQELDLRCHDLWTEIENMIAAPALAQGAALNDEPVERHPGPWTGPDAQLARADLSSAEYVALAEMVAACRGWLRCPAGRRPSVRALGQRVVEIAAGLEGDQ